MVNVLYEDNHIIVVVKPQGVPSQEDSSEDKDMLTLVKEYLKEKYDKPGNVYVGLVHRLDRPTGGVMIFAKTSKSASRLCQQIKDGDVKKTYLAILSQTPLDYSARLMHYLKKDEKENIVKVTPRSEAGAKKAELVYNIIDTYKEIALAEVDLLTGRSHQIRVQFATIKCPLVNDNKYNKNALKGNLGLWAYSLKFTHPVTKQPMVFKCYPNTEESPWKYFNYSQLK